MTPPDVPPEAEVVPCRLHVLVGSDEAQLVALTEPHGIAREIVAHALDPRERARFHQVRGVSLLVLLVPFRADRASAGKASTTHYATASLVIVHRDSEIVVMSATENDVVTALRAERDAKGPTTAARTFAAALEAIAVAYLAQLEEIDHAISRIEASLVRSMNNREVVELLQYQKTLVHFTASLRASSALADRLLTSDTIRAADDEERAVLEDAVVELRQAMWVADLARETLGETMDTFASLISNNLNDIMRVMAGAAIVLTPPVAIAGYWGMNVDLPLHDDPHAFALLVLGSLGVSAVVAGVLRLRRWI